jgi:hypothetical protein
MDLHMFRTPTVTAFSYGLLLLQAVLLGYGAYVHSPSNDEVAHLPVGIRNWYFARFDLFRVNPPLIRMVAALPVIAMKPETDWTHWEDEGRPEWKVGMDFISANGQNAFWFFTVARWACIPLSVIGGYICSRWANDLFGPYSAPLALLLWCFSPNILAHGQMITPDLGATSFGLLAAYLFWKWLKESTWKRACLVGFALGLAELTKSTWIILFGLWPALWVIWKICRSDCAIGLGRVKQGLQLAIISFLGLLVLNLGYGFSGSFQKLKDYSFISRTLAGQGSGTHAHGEVMSPGNRFRDSWIGLLPVPLPADFMRGMDLQKSEFERKMHSYLGGKWQNGGWWYYYLYAFAIKVPLGTIFLAMLVFVLRYAVKSPPLPLAEEVFFLAPAIVLFAFVSAQTGFTDHFRYVLPVFPFGFIWLSQIMPLLLGAGTLLRVAACGALLWSVSSSLLIYPHCLSYFNEVVGGPMGGHAHLLFSNMDWGQDLLFLKGWLNKHPEAAPIGLAYFGLTDPSVAGIDYTVPPLGACGSSSGPVMNPYLERRRLMQGVESGPKPGWYAVSVYYLHEESGCYGYFLRFKPVATAGYSIYIYHLSQSEADRVRKEMGLPALADT